MAPQRKIQIKNQKASRTRWDNQEEEAMEEPNCTIYKKVQSDIAILSTQVQGTNYRKAQFGAAIQGNSFPSKSTLYRHQQTMIPKITEKNISSN